MEGAWLYFMYVVLEQRGASKSGSSTCHSGFVERALRVVLELHGLFTRQCVKTGIQICFKMTDPLSSHSARFVTIKWMCTLRDGDR